VARREHRNRAETLLALVGLEGRINHIPAELSGGESPRSGPHGSIPYRPCVMINEEFKSTPQVKKLLNIPSILPKIRKRIEQ
jgi:predicted ABC-type transport system involved in lysophospholipase L1 biosynthesis ATPase subunit